MNGLRVVGAAVLVAAGALVTIGAQSAAPVPSAGPIRSAPAKPFVPVTDEMLWKPDPANWLSWRRTLDGWGYSPLDQIDRSNVSRLKMVWARGMGTGTMEATPLVYDGVMYLPGPGDVIQAIDAKTGDLTWEYRRKLPEGVNGGTNRNIAIWGTTLIDGSADNQIYAVDVHTGNQVWETAVMDAKKRARVERRSDHRQRQGDHRSSVPARRRQRRLHRHRARRQDGQGSVAHADDPAARRARQRDLGRRADDRTLARGQLDGAELRPGDEPDLRRHVGDDSGAEVHAGRQRQDLPVPQLHAGPERRHRQDRLALPARRRSLGSRSSRSSGCWWKRPWRRIPKEVPGSIRG